VALVLCCSSLGFSILQTFFETMPGEAKKRKSWGLHRLHLHLRLTFSCRNRIFMQLALVVFCPSASLAGLVSASSFNHSSWLQCDPRSLRAKDLVQRWTCGFHQISPLWFLRRQKWARSFLAFLYWQKENLTRTKAKLQWNYQIENSSRAQIKYHTAICITCDNWWWILIIGVNVRG